MKSLVLTLGTFLFSLGSFAQAEKSSSKDTAILTFEKSEHNFRTIIEGQIATYEFKFTNTGTLPIVLSNVKASCGCTTPKWPREAIMPGESNVIRAEYNSNGRPGTFHKNIFVTSDAGKQTLTIKGNVVSEPEKPKSPIIINN
jgi:hypothetical protein